MHAILLGGGSAYGLDAASGVMRYLEQQGVGFKFGGAVIPIVPGAILFDLGVGDPKDPAHGRVRKSRGEGRDRWTGRRETSAPERARQSARWAAATAR